MKKRAILGSFLSLVVVFAHPGFASAAACTNKDDYGYVNLALPILPTRGTYNIWTRLQVPDETRSSYQLQVNSDACYEVGGSTVNSKEWTWVNYQNNDPGNKVRYDFENTSDNSVTLIGNNAGVKIDRLLLVKNDCIPVDLGNNCQSESTNVNVMDLSGATQIPPPSTGTVSGTIIPSATIISDASRISKVIYFVDSKAIPTAKGNGLDTTLLSNGPHSLSMQIIYTDSTITNQATTLQVNNEQTAFSPVARFVRLNTRTVITLSSLVGVGLIILLVILIIRHIRLQKRLLTFRGF